MKEKIAQFQANIETWHTTLHREGIWLFIATMSVWSVPNGWLRYLALLFSGFLFASRTLSRRRDIKPFRAQAHEIRKEIELTVSDEDQRKARLFDLGEVEKRTFGSRVFGLAFIGYWIGGAFWFCSLFLMFSCV